jgi:hypothetical protein
MGNTTDMRAPWHSMASIGKAQAAAYRGLDRLALDADLNRLREHIAELERRNQELARQLESARQECHAAPDQ